MYGKDKGKENLIIVIFPAHLFISEKTWPDHDK